MSNYYVLNKYYILVVKINTKVFMFDINLLIYKYKNWLQHYKFCLNCN